LEGLLLFRLSLAAKAVPFGFKNAATFGNFGRLLNGGLARLGLGETKALLQGSAVTGRSFKSGEVFDVGRVSDFDIALAGSGIFNRAKALGIALRSGGTRTGPLTKSQIERLGLKPLRDLLSRLAGRDVNFMIFEDAATAAARAPSVPIP
jgi:filamentous hemagglutinin